MGTIANHPHKLWGLFKGVSYAPEDATIAQHPFTNPFFFWRECALLLHVQNITIPETQNKLVLSFVFSEIIYPIMLKRLLVLAILLAVPIFPGGQGKTIVTTSGTPVQLCASCNPPKSGVCTISALSTNTGTIFLGYSSAVSAANKLGTPLGPPTVAGQPGASFACNPGGNAAIWPLTSLWLDATVSGEGVSYSWN